MEDPQPRPPEGAQSINQPDVSPDVGADPTPDVVDDSGGSRLPSLSRRQALALGAVVAIVVVVALLRARNETDDDEDSPELQDAEQFDASTVEKPADGQGGPIDVPNDRDDVLAADEAILTALEQRGKITGAS